MIDPIQRIRRKFALYPCFAVKTLLYRHVPGGWGYYRMLARLKDESYVHDRDKAEVRRKHHGGGGWKEKRGEDGFVYRDYSDYEEYKEHQKVKFDEILKTGEGFTPRVVGDLRTRFLRRFRHLPYHLTYDARILCAGARQGTEVEVLRDIGFRNAFGNDLNPGPENPWVVEGDFMHLSESDDSLDMVYCNAIDHVANMDDFLSEQVRVIKEGGFALYEAIPQTKGGAFEAVEWADDAALFRKLLEYFGRIIRVETEPHLMWMLLKDPVKDRGHR